MSPETRERYVRNFTRWLFEQSSTTVCLLLLVGGGFYYTPKLIDALERSNAQKDAAHSRDLRTVTNAYERDQARDDDRYRELSERLAGRMIDKRTNDKGGP